MPEHNVLQKRLVQPLQHAVHYDEVDQEGSRITIEYRLGYHFSLALNFFHSISIRWSV